MSSAAEQWQRMLDKYRVEETPVAPVVSLVANDNWIEFTVRYAVHYKRRRITKDRLFSRILEEIDNSHGQVALASATFELVGLPPLDIRLPPAGQTPAPASAT
jgi:hypothetical protein